jgi:hypothetical protein
MPLDLGEVEPHRPELLPLRHAQRNRRLLERRDAAPAELVEPGTQDDEIGGPGEAWGVHTHPSAETRLDLNDRPLPPARDGEGGRRGRQVRRSAAIDKEEVETSMRKYLLLLAGVVALSCTGAAAATLVPGVFDPDTTGCPVATYAGGVLHLEKNCPTPTNASAGADITGFSGQTFTSASFTLASPSQCQGGSPRFDVVTSDATFFLGCNNVNPTANGDGSATYTFDAASLAVLNQVPVPTGTISAVDVLIDVEGTADLSNITFNGAVQTPAPVTSPTKKSDCKKGGWKSFSDPTFTNQGQCVSWFNHHSGHGKGKSQPAAATAKPGKAKGKK